MIRVWVKIRNLFREKKICPQSQYLVTKIPLSIVCKYKNNITNLGVLVAIQTLDVTRTL